MLSRQSNLAALMALFALMLAGRSEAFSSQISGIHASTSSRLSTKTEFFNKAPSKPASISTALSMNSNEVQGTDRILSCIPYVLPLMDGDRYGRFIFALVPALGMADALLLSPFKLIYYGIPFAQFAAFIGMSFLSRNPELPRSVRFNIQQALVLDIFLIFPSLFGQLHLPFPRVLVESGSNFIFYVLVASVGYSLFSNLTGKIPNQIPVISEASEMQIGPF